MIKVSVIVPVYNIENLLKYTIESILNQTLKDIEVILVDDGSTDKSGNICDYYEKIDSRVKVIHKKNGGGASARNEGAKLARGEYLYYVDCDDMLTFNQLEIMYQIGLETDSDLVFADAYMLDPAGNKTELNVHRRNNKSRYTVYSLSNKSSKELLYENYNFTTCRAYWFHLERAKVYKNFISPHQPNDDSYALFQKLSLADKVTFIHENLYLYRFPRDGSIMNNFKAPEFCLYGIDLRVMFGENMIEYFGWSRSRADYLIKQYFVAYDHISYYKGEDWNYVREYIKYRLNNITKYGSIKNKIRVSMLVHTPKLYRYYVEKKKNKAYLKPI